MIENGLFVFQGMKFSFEQVFFISLAMMAVGGVCTLYRGHTLLRVFTLTFGYGLGLCGISLLCMAVYLLFTVYAAKKASGTSGPGKVEHCACAIDVTLRPCS
jgi:hypothetical protein